MQIDQPTSVTRKDNKAWAKVKEIQKLCQADGKIILMWKGNPVHGQAKFRGWINPENGEDESRVDRISQEGQPVFKKYGFAQDETSVVVNIKSEDELYMYIGNPDCRESPYALMDKGKSVAFQYYVANQSLAKKEELEKLEYTQEANTVYNKLQQENDPENLFTISNMLGNFSQEPSDVLYCILDAVRSRPQEFIETVNDPQRKIKSTLLHLKSKGVVRTNGLKWEYMPNENAKPIFLGYDFDESIKNMTQNGDLQASMITKLEQLNPKKTKK